MIRERRAFELRAATDGGAELEGIAMPFGSRGQVGRFTEEFTPGSLSFDDVLVNVLHDPGRILARSGGGLVLRESREALRAAITLPDTQEGRDTRELVKAGVLRGLSVEFRCERDEWRGTHRIVHKAFMDAIGIVARPAYAGATIAEGRELRSEDFFAGKVSTKGRVRRWRSL